ncbi:group II intron maturase-specific domain-containing protein [Rhizobium sp. 007]|uniref:group II intron maturase-specific domain-containing protein n=1 Tax=Rhizobium sp. 007 TaxID=2785056 RepID=UPI001FEF1F17|nr:group II intron maturase-specific domain-containing protein [Rhizobium sp. 007]
MISPLLANLFLHYAFDMWMCRNFPDIPFERYADDAICHCRTEDQAMALQKALDARFTDCGLTLHPDKTKIVYCKDESRRGTHPVYKFDFLGYTFQPRLVSKKAGGMSVSFSPAASPTALKAIRGTIRSWSLHLRSDKALDDLARMFNSYIRGWINYYGRFCPSALQPTLWSIERYLARWATGKYKSLRRHKRRSRHWLLRIAQRQPRLFAHWPLLHGYGRTMGAG